MKRWWMMIALAGMSLALGSCTDTADEEQELPWVINTEQFPSRYLYIGQTEGYSSDTFPVEVVDAANWYATSLERMPAPITSAGIEDAPFITMDGKTLYFTFIGDEDSTPVEQLDDPTVGIYFSDFDGANWSEPEKIGLVPNGVKALTGGGSIKSGNEFWFNMVSSATAGEVQAYRAYKVYDTYTVGYDPGPPIATAGVSLGEPDISYDRLRLYVNSPEVGGEGANDIFVFTNWGGIWYGPDNLGTNVNSAGEDIQPFITYDNEHLYFASTDGTTGTGFSIFRCDWTGSEWGPKTEVLRNNVGEPSLTWDGEWLYFVHFYFDGGMNRLEADVWRVQAK
jgi:hypothetical protein